MWLGLSLLLSFLGFVQAALQIAIVMQGSDFINVTIVPDMDVRQYDLGDVFLSPCPMNTFSPGHEGRCRDCTTCETYQFDSMPCVSYRDRTCSNCTECSETEQEICACGERVGQCYLGDRVCSPLAPVSINVSFTVSFSVQLSKLQLSFFQEGMKSGFILFMANYLQVTTDHIVLLSLSQISPIKYQAMYLAQNVYSQYAVQRLQSFTDAVVQAGLAYTFGWGGNTVISRRLLQAANVLPQGTVTGTGHNCYSSDCPQFYVKANCGADCCTECQWVPCYEGYTGDLGKCTICPNATYKDTAGNATCSSCPPGFTSDQGSVSISQCWLPPTTSTTTSGIVTTTTTGSVLAVTTSVAGSTSVGIQTSSHSQAVSSGAGSSSSSGTTTSRGQTTSSTTGKASSTATLPVTTPAPTSSAPGPVPAPPPVPGPPPGPGPAPGPAVVQGGTQYYVSGNYMVVTNQSSDLFLEVGLVCVLFVCLMLLAWMASMVSSSRETSRRPGRMVYIPVPIDDSRPAPEIWNRHRQDVWMD